MMLQALKAPPDLIPGVGQNLIRMFVLGVLQPIVLAPFPLAVPPNLAHEASGQLVDAFSFMLLHQLEGQSNRTSIFDVGTGKLELSNQSLKSV